MVLPLGKNWQLPYSPLLAHIAHTFFKIALKTLGKIASHLAHSENESFREQLLSLCLLSGVTSVAVLGNGEYKL